MVGPPRKGWSFYLNKCRLCVDVNEKCPIRNVKGIKSGLDETDN